MGSLRKIWELHSTLLEARSPEAVRQGVTRGGKRREGENVKKEDTVFGNSSKAQKPFYIHVYIYTYTRAYILKTYLRSSLTTTQVHRCVPELQDASKFLLRQHKLA